MEYDVAVVGGGPGGYYAALTAARQGADVVLFEKQAIGGTCLNIGCIPTKCYVSQAELLQRIVRGTECGILKNAGLFSFKKIFEYKEKVVRQLVSGVTLLLQTAGVTMVPDEAECIDAHTIRAAGQEYSAKNIILATGSKNQKLSIPGIDGKNVIDSTELLALDKIPNQLIIIGAGVIGLEFACIMNSFGCHITAVDIVPSILSEEDPAAVDFLFQSMQKDGIQFYLGSRVTAIEDNKNGKRVLIEQAGNTIALEAEYVLVCTGRQPNNEQALRLGLKMDDKGFPIIDEFMHTSREHVYAVGDIAGGYLLAHSAYMEGETAAINCMGGYRATDLSVMPRCIFTLPGYAAVGVMEHQALEAVKTGHFPFSASGKALAGGMSEGFVKWVSEESTGRLTGCCIVGNEAAELLHIAVAAINMKATVADFERMVFAHPTLGESVKEAALDIAGKAIHLPQKRN